MYKYVVEGGLSLRGKVQVNGNKNSALPCIVAALLTSDKVTLHNIPDIEDVSVLFSILQDLGAVIEDLGKGSYLIESSNINSYEIDSNKARAIRASILLMGPVLARMGRIILPPPGGDVIGRRRLDTHFLALSQLGANYTIKDVFDISSPNGLKGNDIFLDEASVTATENVIMAAVTAKGETTLSNVACEPHVQDLCHMLVSMGADIRGIGSNHLIIQGVNKLRGTEFTIGSDFMEAGSLIALAAITNSELELINVQEKHLRMVKIGFEKLGVHWESSGNSLFISKNQSLVMRPDMGGSIAKIDDAPWPGFPPDLMSIMIVVATQCEGTILFHEKMFESRMFFVDKLIAMGARIILCDPHRAVVSGKSSLKGSSVSSPDVRAGMAILLAALCAEGVSEINNIYQIERGYAKIYERLNSLGAKIKKVLA